MDGVTYTCQTCKRVGTISPPLWPSEPPMVECAGCTIKAMKQADEQAALTTAERIASTCERIEALLLEKNEAYGDSALNPVRVFSKADAVEQLRVRIDDKLSRLMRGHPAGEDVILDLIGYLVLLLIATETKR